MNEQVERLQEEVDRLKRELSAIFAVEKMVSDRYVRLREMLAPWGALDTKSGGEDRFERTEAALTAVIALALVPSLQPETPTEAIFTPQQIAYLRARLCECAVCRVAWASKPLAQGDALGASRPSPAARKVTWHPMDTLPKDRWVWAVFGVENPEISAVRWNLRLLMWQSGTGYWRTHMPFTGWTEMEVQPPGPSPAPKERT
jgi:hypothetical protein